MNLKNLKTCCELRSENPTEAFSLVHASMKSYSPRCAGLMQNEDQMLVLTRQDAHDFMSGVLTDVDIHPRDKWAISKLVSSWLLCEIKDEACA